MSSSSGQLPKPNKILPYLYLGGRNEAKSLSTLQEMNIFITINYGIIIIERDFSVFLDQQFISAARVRLTLIVFCFFIGCR
jgi:hypothetical protein